MAAQRFDRSSTVLHVKCVPPYYGVQWSRAEVSCPHSIRLAHVQAWILYVCWGSCLYPGDVRSPHRCSSRAMTGTTEATRTAGCTGASVHTTCAEPTEPSKAPRTGCIPFQQGSYLQLVLDTHQVCTLWLSLDSDGTAPVESPLPKRALGPPGIVAPPAQTVPLSPIPLIRLHPTLRPCVHCASVHGFPHGPSYLTSRSPLSRTLPRFPLVSSSDFSTSTSPDIGLGQRCRLPQSSS